MQSRSNRFASSTCPPSNALFAPKTSSTSRGEYGTAAPGGGGGSGTNFLDVTVRVVRGKVVVLAAEDNLVRGASGVAVQNFNLMFGHDERDGLL